MQDRQPGAPGQYILKISVEEVQKLLNSEECVVILTRNDQPIVEGTPLNKASFLPDDLAAEICPDIEDPTPADALKSLQDKKTDAKFVTVTLPTSGWVDNAQTVDVPGVTADEENCHPRPYPATVSHAVFYDCDVHGIAQLDGKITFGCEEVPSVDITVYIEILFGRMTKV